MYMPIICVALALALAYASQRVHLALQRRRFALAHGCGAVPRESQLDAVLGLDIFMHTLSAVRARRFLAHLDSRFRRVGHTYAARIMGDDRLFTDDPRNLQAVLATQFADFELGGHRRASMRPLLGAGIFAADGAAWSHARRLATPAFARRQVADLRSLETHVGALLARLPAGGAVVVDMQEWYPRLLLNTATEFLFGECVDALHADASGEHSAFSAALNTALSGIAFQLRMGRFWWLYRSREFDRSVSFLRAYVRPIVQRAMADSRRAKDAATTTTTTTEPERYVLLTELARQTDDAHGLEDQLLSFLLAGRDTLAALLSSCTFVLATRPDVCARVRSEVDAVLPQTQRDGRRPPPPSYADIKAMRTLDAFLRETLRLYPPVPLNQRVATRDTTLPAGGGPDGTAPVFVPRGRIVTYAVYSTHRREDVWGPDAAEFRLERWQTARPGYGFLPFNGGPRICIGQQYAMVQAAYTLVRLLQTFSRIDAVDSGPWTEGLHLTCSVGQGVRVRLTRATNEVTA